MINLQVVQILLRRRTYPSKELYMSFKGDVRLLIYIYG